MAAHATCQQRGKAGRIEHAQVARELIRRAADATLRKRIRAELRSIMQPALGSTTLSKNSQSTPPATTREADGEKDAHARKALLAELTRTATRMGRSGN